MIDICTDKCPCNQCNTEPEDCELAKAYMKQISKKPYYLNYGGRMIGNWHCSNGHIINKEDSFCKQCQQAIDWSGDDE